MAERAVRSASEQGEARRGDCEAEVRLNRRFAPKLYLGTVALTLEASAHLQLGGRGEICDWLVKMVRLPSERTLESKIARDEVGEGEVRKAVHLLARVYRRAVPIDMAADAYRRSRSRPTCRSPSPRPSA